MCDTELLDFLLCKFHDFYYSQNNYIIREIRENYQVYSNMQCSHDYRRFCPKVSEVGAIDLYLSALSPMKIWLHRLCVRIYNDIINIKVFKKKYSLIIYSTL